MSDKAKRSHIERTVYVAPTVKPGDSVRHGNWQEREDLARRCSECYGSGATQDRRTWRDVRCDACRGTGRVEPVPFTIIDYATGGDYSGTLAEASNARSLKRDFPWLVKICGGYGTFGVGYLGRRENQSDALIEAIDALTDYPLYDEDDHSALEHEREYEAWEFDGRDDFKRALVAYFNAQYEPDEHDLSDEGFDAEVDLLWSASVDRLQGGEGFLNESGGNIYFPIGRVIEKYERDWPGMSRPGYDGSPSLDEMLVRLAESCTLGLDEVADDDLMVARDAWIQGREEWKTLIPEHLHTAATAKWSHENNAPSEDSNAENH